MPQNEVFFLKIAHIAPSLCFSTKGIFSDGPKGFECIWDLCACSWERQLAFLAPGKAPNGFFSLRIAHITLSLCFCTIEIFFRWSQRDGMHLGPLCMQLRAPVSFFSLWEGQKFFSLRIAHIAPFYTINFFF